MFLSSCKILDKSESHPTKDHTVTIHSFTGLKALLLPRLQLFQSPVEHGRGLPTNRPIPTPSAGLCIRILCPDRWLDSRSLDATSYWAATLILDSGTCARAHVGWAGFAAEFQPAKFHWLNLLVQGKISIAKMSTIHIKPTFTGYFAELSGHKLSCKTGSAIFPDGQNHFAKDPEVGCMFAGCATAAPSSSRPSQKAPAATWTGRRTYRGPVPPQAGASPSM